MTSPAVFTHSFRIYYEDTDAGGVVFHSNYLNLMDRCRSEWLRQLGYTRQTMQAENFILFVHSATLRWLAPAQLDDEVSVSVAVEEVRKTSIIVHQRIIRTGDELLLCEGSVRLTRANRTTLKSELLPEAFAARLTDGVSAAN